jgi:hypothetical protein
VLAGPLADDREVASVDHGQAARKVAVAVAEHRHGDDVAGHAMHRVWRGEPRLLNDLLRLDHVAHARGQRVADVEQVGAGGAQARHHQRVPVQLRVTRRGARVPAEVVQLVADVGHVGPTHDLPVLRRGRLDVDDCDEVGALDTRALVQAGYVNEALGRLTRGDLRCRVARSDVLVAVVVLITHGALPL